MSDEVKFEVGQMWASPLCGNRRRRILDVDPNGWDITYDEEHEDGDWTRYTRMAADLMSYGWILVAPAPEKPALQTVAIAPKHRYAVGDRFAYADGRFFEVVALIHNDDPNMCLYSIRASWNDYQSNWGGRHDCFSHISGPTFKPVPIQPPPTCNCHSQQLAASSSEGLWQHILKMPAGEVVVPTDLTSVYGALRKVVLSVLVGAYRAELLVPVFRLATDKIVLDNPNSWTTELRQLDHRFQLEDSTYIDGRDPQNIESGFQRVGIEAGQ